MFLYRAVVRRALNLGWMDANSHCTNPLYILRNCQPICCVIASFTMYNVTTKSCNWPLIWQCDLSVITIGMPGGEDIATQTMQTVSTHRVVLYGHNSTQVWFRCGLDRHRIMTIRKLEIVNLVIRLERIHLNTSVWKQASPPPPPPPLQGAGRSTYRIRTYFRGVQIFAIFANESQNAKT